jgi:hypothetical protein
MMHREDILPLFAKEEEDILPLLMNIMLAK